MSKYKLQYIKYIRISLAFPHLMPTFICIYISIFFRFPKDDKLRLEWVQKMGRLNWIPKKRDALCSEHFSKDAIHFRDTKARLRKGSIPIYFDGNKENSNPIPQCHEIRHIRKSKFKTLPAISNIFLYTNKFTQGSIQYFLAGRKTDDFEDFVHPSCSPFNISFTLVVFLNIKYIYIKLY